MSVVYKPGEWAVQNEPADNAAATIAKAAVAGYRHYVTSITCTLEGGANTAEVHFVLRDSTTGAGNILWAGKLLNLANTSSVIALGGINIQGVKGQAVTLETVAAPAASSSATVAMTGYTLTD